ncbi:MAG: hypothetical protein K0Q87_2838 [Neobacillus sp.]|nr:hypothetical protein [Neobacillus sp.]
MFYERVEEDEFRKVHFEVEVEKQHVQSKKSDIMEVAIKNLQKALPANIRLAGCISCKHGNFNPFGDVENEIFCLKDKTLHNREDVVEIFSNQVESMSPRSRSLLDFCKEFEPIAKIGKYTYNDWEI